jgi:hypothetical protein
MLLLLQLRLKQVDCVTEISHKNILNSFPHKNDMEISVQPRQRLLQKPVYSANSNALWRKNSSGML